MKGEEKFIEWLKNESKRKNWLKIMTQFQILFCERIIRKTQRFANVAKLANQAKVETLSTGK